MKKKEGNSFFCIIRSLLLIAIIAPLTITGCESKIVEPEQAEAEATVSGTVTLNDKPLSQVAISFFSLQFGVVGEAPLDKDGKFILADPISPGEYRIFFVPEDGQIPNGIPQKYLIETSSDHSVTVEESHNQLKIDIKS